MSNRLHQDVVIQGPSGTAYGIKALVDTGASVSMIPTAAAEAIGATATGNWSNIVGVHRDARLCPEVQLGLWFPSLGNRGVPDARMYSGAPANELVIGMDILGPLGLTVDASTKSLFVGGEPVRTLLAAVGLGVIIKWLGDRLGGDE